MEKQAILKKISNILKGKGVSDILIKKIAKEIRRGMSVINLSICKNDKDWDIIPDQFKNDDTVELEIKYEYRINYEKPIFYDKDGSGYPGGTYYDFDIVSIKINGKKVSSNVKNDISNILFEEIDKEVENDLKEISQLTKESFSQAKPHVEKWIEIFKKAQTEINDEEEMEKIFNDIKRLVEEDIKYADYENDKNIPDAPDGDEYYNSLIYPYVVVRFSGEDTEADVRENCFNFYFNGNFSPYDERWKTNERNIIYIGKLKDISNVLKLKDRIEEIEIDDKYNMGVVLMPGTTNKINEMN